MEYPEKDYIIFQFHADQAITDLQIQNMKQPNIIFPCFDNNSYNKRILTYRDAQFLPAQRDFDYVTAPVCLFDDLKNVVVISALDHFITNGIRKDHTISNDIQIQCGVNGHVTKIPPNHTHTYIMLFHNGINQSMKYWGKLLTTYHNSPKKERYSDIVCNSLGYFTDNGAHYYYNTIEGQKYDYTLFEVKKHADQLGIPYQYYQLDSWWYKKSLQKWKRDIQGYFGRIFGGGLFGGTMEWTPDPDALDMSLEELYQHLGKKPFIAHNRWFSNKTPYKDQFEFDIIQNRAMSVDPAFWDHIMAYCKSNHIEVYEQDWLSTHMEKMPRLHTEIGYAETWLKNMAKAAQNHDVAIQYCMATPAMIMNSIHLKAVTNCRSAEDYNPRWPHRYDVPPFFQSSVLAAAVGLNVIKDTFHSTTSSRLGGEKFPELMVITAALGGGPICPGDAIGKMNEDMLKATCRSDGKLYKPSYPMTPADITFIKNSTYFIGTTFTQIGDQKWFYTLTMNFWPRRVKNPEYMLSDIGIEGFYIEYDWFTNEIRQVSANSQFQEHLQEEQYRFKIYAPLIQDTYAILGDMQKIIMLNDCEFMNIESESQKCSLTVSNIENERMEILLYATRAPSQVLINGELIQKEDNHLSHCWSYRLESKLVKLHINFEKTQNFGIEIFF